MGHLTDANGPPDQWARPLRPSILTKEHENVEGRCIQVSNFEQIQRLADRYVSDPEFRGEMDRDMEGTARRFGVELDGATRQALRGVSGGALSRRVSYRMMFC